MNNIVNVVANIKPKVKINKNGYIKKENKNIEKSNDTNNTEKNDFKDLLKNATESKNTNEKIHKDEKTISKEDELDKTKKHEEKPKSMLDIIMELLNQMIKGDITSKEFTEKVSNNPELLEKLSDKISMDIVKLIENQLTKGDLKLNPESILDNNLNLQEKIKNSIEQVLKEFQGNDMKANSSFEEIANKLSEGILKTLKDLNVVTSNNANNGQAEIQKQIENLIKSKLLENTSKEDTSNNKQSKEFASSIPNDLKIKGNNMQNTNQQSSSKESNSEDSFLKDLALGSKEKSNPKIEKAMNFMEGFNKINSTNVGNVEEVQSPVAINRDNFINDVIKSVKFMEQNDMKELTVKIMPKELGEVVIKLTMENGLMKANITANNKDTFNLLNSNIQELNSNASDGVVKIQNFTVDIYNGDTTFFSRENSREQDKQNGSRNKGRSTKISSLENEMENIEKDSAVEQSNVNAFV